MKYASLFISAGLLVGCSFVNAFDDVTEEQGQGGAAASGGTSAGVGGVAGSGGVGAGVAAAVAREPAGSGVGGAVRVAFGSRRQRRGRQWCWRLGSGRQRRGRFGGLRRHGGDRRWIRAGAGVPRERRLQSGDR
ncbi:MAG: hypothetical protein KIT72_13760 [Polyangiaceae bacterium]|nr:hypothetical protein [Polyangiaceae bacterium]